MDLSKSQLESLLEKAEAAYKVVSGAPDRPRGVSATVALEVFRAQMLPSTMIALLQELISVREENERLKQL